MSLSILALILIVSVSSSPSVMLPPTVTLPVTSKLPVILTLSCKLMLPVELLILISPLVLLIVFPLTLIFPASTFVPSIIVVFVPSVNVIPWLLLNKNSALVNVTSPVSWLTLNKSPTLKSPLWSTVLKYIFASLLATTSFAWITSVTSLVTSLPVPM